jgi:hypothetical protein
MTTSTIILLIILGVSLLFPLLICVVFGSTFVMALAHRPEHVPLRRAPEAADFTSSLAREHLEQATSMGFQRVATIETEASHQQNEPTCVVMLSEDRLVLMLISAQAKLMGFSLYSQMQNGYWLQTEQKLDDPGMSPYYQTAQVVDSTMQQLLACHLDRLDEAAMPCLPFEPDRVLDDLFAQETKHVEHIIAQGLGKWTNPTRTAWRMTIRGAFRYAWLCATSAMDKETLERNKKYVANR